VECGEIIRAKAVTCPECGCEQESRRATRFECPYCGTRELPLARQKIATAGWIVFVVLLIFFFSLCFLGLFITEDYQCCYDCGATLHR
jgi:hypothetical protein